jgi:hypothetical protein
MDMIESKSKNLYKEDKNKIYTMNYNNKKNGLHLHTVERK